MKSVVHLLKLTGQNSKPTQSSIASSNLKEPKPLRKPAYVDVWKATWGEPNDNHFHTIAIIIPISKKAG